MLTTDVRFEGWSVTDWFRLLDFFAAPSAPEHAVVEPARALGGAIVVHDGNRVLKLLHTETGRLEPTMGWPTPLSEVARMHSARWAISIYFGALDEVMERFGARVYRGDTLTEQSLSLLHVFREMIVEGVVETWPEQLRSFPIPAPVMLTRATDAFCPVGQSFVLGAFSQDDLWTCLVLRRAARGFDLVAGPDELRRHLGLLSGEVRRDYRHLASAIDATYGPIGFGCYGYERTLKELSRDSTPGAWARAVAVRDVILSPVPFGIGFAMGIDVTRALLHKLAELFRAGPLGAAFDPLVGEVQQRVGAVTGSDVLTVLGFDPMAALRTLLTR